MYISRCVGAIVFSVGGWGVLCLGLLGCQIAVTLPPSGTNCQVQGTCASPKTPVKAPPEVPRACSEEPGLVCPKDLCKTDKDCGEGQRCSSTKEGMRCVGAVDCSRLSDLDCWKSRPSCVLEYVSENKYLCRAARNECEKQIDSKSCEASSRCAYDPGRCFCPPDPRIDCFCGGGPPPLCRLASELCKGGEDCAKFCMERYQCCAEGASLCIDSLLPCSLVNRVLPKVCVTSVDCGALSRVACHDDPRCSWLELPVEEGSPACVPRP